MDTWPRGRTLAYGVMFQEGPIVVQQPRFTPRRIVDADPASLPDLPANSFRQNAQNRNNPETHETASQAQRGNVTPLFRVSVSEEVPSSKTKSSGVSEETKKIILRMYQNKDKPMKLRDIAPLVGLAGEKYGMFQLACRELGIAPNNPKVEEA
jgi:hypothetical protein